MARHSYRLEALDPHLGTWVPLFGEVGLEYGRGYLQHQREAPGPRLALRLVRQDGRVMDETSALTEAGIGMIAGWPTAEQYRNAAQRCLLKAEEIEARERRQRERELERGRSG